MTEPIAIELNGEAYRIEEGATLDDLVRKLSLEKARIAVEHNLRVVPRAEHGTMRLVAGDRVEIVTFVGGG
jgi:thiamine biosynthesis protein ThiS